MPNVQFFKLLIVSINEGILQNIFRWLQLGNSSVIFLLQILEKYIFFTELS